MPTKDEILEIGINVDIKAATKEMAKFQKSVLKHMQAVTKAIDKMGKVNEKVTETAVKDSEEWADATGDLGKTIGTLEKKLAKAGKEESRTIKENIKLLKDTQKQRAKLAGGGGGKSKSPMGDPKAFGKEAKEGMKEAAEAFKGSVSSFFGKDLKSTVESLGKALGKGVGAGAKAIRPGERLKAAGAGMRQRGAEVGGVKGGAMKGIGKMMGGMGKVLSVVGKLGPLISTAASAMMAVVKFFIDAEAAAKEFQKGVLESTGNVEFLAAAGGNTNLAFQNLKDTVEGVRDAAFAYSNIDWGITADTHKAVLNTLNQEGVSLKRMADEAGRGRENAQAYASELVHVNVAYSRAFGVSLSEIGQMQGEMMSELGMNLDTTKLAFTQMARSATESGIASNKFFSMIRGVSQDLSLYNLRIEDAAKLLGKLGKVMNPRNAAKFMQTLTGFMKNMDIDSRMRMQLLAGKKGGAILEKDIQRRTKSLNKDISAAFKGAMSPKQVSAALKDPKLASEMWSKLRKVAPGQAGALRGSASELKTAQIAKGKGVYGKAVAMRNMGAIGSLQMAKASLGVKGKGTLQSARGGLGFEKFAQMLNIDEEMLAGMIKFETALEDQRADLLAEAQSKEEKDKIRGMDEADLLDSMTDEQRKAVQSSAKIETIGEKQASLQQSLLDKLGVLIDFMMNQFYNVVMGIWEAMPDILTGAADEIAQAKIERKLMASGNKELQEIAGKGLNLGELKDALKQRALGGGAPSAEDKKALERAEHAKKMLASGGATGALSEEAIMSVPKGFQTGEEGFGPSDYWKKVIAEADPAKGRMKGVAAEQSKSRAAMLGLVSGTHMGPGGGMSRMEDKMPAGMASGAVGDLMGLGPEASGKDLEAIFKKYNVPKEQQDQLFQNLADSLDSDQLLGLAEDQAAEQEAAKKVAEDGTKAAAATAKTLGSPGTAYFKFSNSFFGKYKKGIGEVFLESLRKALFEYWQYSGLDREKVGEAMKAAGLTPAEFAKQIGEEVEDGQKAGTKLGLESAEDAEDGKDGKGKDGKGGKVKGTYGAGKWEQVPGGASGLMITGHQGEIARTRSLGNEYLVGAKPGEVLGTPDRLGRALGGGGGGGKSIVELRFKGDARQLIEAVVVDTVHDMKRRGGLA